MSFNFNIYIYMNKLYIERITCGVTMLMLQYQINNKLFIRIIFHTIYGYNTIVFLE